MLWREHNCQPIGTKTKWPVISFPEAQIKVRMLWPPLPFSAVTHLENAFRTEDESLGQSERVWVWPGLEGLEETAGLLSLLHVQMDQKTRVRPLGCNLLGMPQDCAKTQGMPGHHQVILWPAQEIFAPHGGWCREFHIDASSWAWECGCRSSCSLECARTCWCAKKNTIYIHSTVYIVTYIGIFIYIYGRILSSPHSVQFQSCA